MDEMFHSTAAVRELLSKAFDSVALDAFCREMT